MSREAEVWYDDNTLLIGELVSSDASFSHEHGFKKQTQLEVEKLRVIVYIGNMDTDVTDSKQVQKRMEHFKESFLNGLSEEQREIA